MNKSFAPYVLAVLLLSSACVSSAKAASPFAGNLDLTIISATVPNAEYKVDLIGTFSGQSTLIGNFTGWAFYTLDLPSGGFTGNAVKVAANGDLIYEKVVGGYSDPGYTNSSGTITITQGTGRFKNASGSGSFVGLFSSPTQGALTFNSSCDFSASNRAQSPAANSSDYEASGRVIFSNIQGGLGGQLVPYVGVSSSPRTGLGVQSGTIQATSALVPVAPDKIQFSGKVGPHPVLGTNVHVISTTKGDIYCTWTAVFTLQGVAPGVVTFSGDGDFTVTGGTGIYRKATGSFRTLFSTESIAATSVTASATVSQIGNIVR